MQWSHSPNPTPFLLWQTGSPWRTDLKQKSLGSCRDALTDSFETSKCVHRRTKGKGQTSLRSCPLFCLSLWKIHFPINVSSFTYYKGWGKFCVDFFLQARSFNCITGIRSYMRIPILFHITFATVEWIIKVTLQMLERIRQPQVAVLHIPFKSF